MFVIFSLISSIVIAATTSDYIRYAMFVNGSSGTITSIPDYLGRVNWTVNGTMRAQVKSWGGQNINITNSSGSDHASFLQTAHKSTIWPSGVEAFTKGCFVYLIANITTQQVWSSPYYTTGNNRSDGMTLSTNPASGFQITLGGATAGNTTNSVANVVKPSTMGLLIASWNRTQQNGVPQIYWDGTNVTTTSSPAQWRDVLHYSTLDRWLMDYHSGTTREFLAGAGIGECFELTFAADATQIASINSSFAAGNNIVDWVTTEFGLNPPSGSCSYVSGTWNVNDNCNITSSINLGGNVANFNCTGTVKIQTGGRIFNFSKVKNSANCKVWANGGQLG